MIIGFQQHYTPAEMLKGDPKSLTAQVDERGNPNYLLNPQHRDFQRVKLSRPEPFRFDLRLLKSEGRRQKAEVRLR